MEEVTPSILQEKNISEFSLLRDDFLTKSESQAQMISLLGIDSNFGRPHDETQPLSLVKELNGEIEEIPPDPKIDEPSSENKLSLEVKGLLSPIIETIFDKGSKLASSKRLSEEMKSLCSSIRNPSGPILKFSEIFAPPTPIDAFVPKKKPKIAHLPDSEDGLESDDEEELFDRYYNLDDNLDGGIDVQSSPEEEMMGKPMKEDDREPIERIIPPPSTFDAIQQQPWEERIIWERKEEEKEEVPIAAELRKSSTKNLWGEIQEKPPSPIPPERSFTIREPAQASTKKISPTSNPELETGKWIDCIIWNDDVSVADISLILDLNDRNVFPSDPTKMFNRSRVSLVDSTRKHRVEKIEDNIDKSNLSNDEFYRAPRNKGGQKLGKTRIQHSEPALKLSLVKTHLTKDDLINFHRPILKLKEKEKIKVFVNLGKKNFETPNQTQKDVSVMRHKADLSGKDKRVVLVEYVEQHPPIIMNVGMGTKVRNYYRKKNANDNPLLRHDDGENMLLERTDDSPFVLGDIEPGKTIQAIDNNLFRSPIFKHTVAETDFLIVKNGNKAYIREIPTIYTVGQIQPKMEVPAPNSKVANEYIKRRLQSYIFKLFMKKSTGQRLKINDVMSLFPGSSETSIRKRLKECADFQRGGNDSGWWTIKDQSQFPNEDDLRNMCTPEDACLYESMLAGHYRLQAAGVTRFTTITPPFTQALQQLEEKADVETQKAAHVLEEELQLTPWNLTENFINSSQGKGMLQLTGLGDPSGGRGEAFSYVKMPQKGSTKSHKEKDALPKVQVTGTDADLRKLSLENARLVLLKFGVPEDHIQRLERWKRIALVRQKSSEAAAQGEAKMNKFARGARYTLTQQYAQHQEQIQMIFDNQIRALSDPNPEYSDEEADSEDEEEVEHFGKELENMIDTDQKKRKRNSLAEERAERYELEKFLKDEIYTEHQPTKSDTPAPPNQTTESLEGVKRFVKRTVTTCNPDGTKSERVEIVTDPEQIETCLAREREKRRSGIPRRLKQALSPEDEEERNKIRREKRRLQEQLRRLRKNREKQEEYKQKMALGLDNSDEVTANSKFKCGACNMWGHMRTNRNCPLYSESNRENNSELTYNPDQIKVKGNKLVFSKDVIKNSFPQLKIKIKKQDIGLEGEEDYLAKSAKRRRRTGNSGAQVAFSNLLEKVLNKLKAHQCAPPFSKPVPVNMKYAPDYYKVIKEPMDLSTIRSKIRAFHYSSRTEFMNDMKLMIDNCYIYNKDRNPHLLPMADAIYEAAETALEELEPEITDLETELRPNPDEQQTPAQPLHSDVSSTFNK